MNKNLITLVLAVYVSSVQSIGFNGTPSGYFTFKSYGKYPSRISDKTL